MAGDRLKFSSFDFSNETEFENIILKNNILDNYHVYDAKKTLNDFRKYNRYADVLLISKDLKYWSIGEVEISSHSFKRHVFPQLLEIHSLMEKNLSYIRENFLKITDLPKEKEVEDLIKYNRPFLTLIIDKVPTLYVNALPLLNTFCNVITVTRFKDDDENYAYYDQSFRLDDLENEISTAYIRDNFLTIDNPNLLSLHKMNSFMIDYKGLEYITTLQFPIKHGDSMILIWTIDNDNIRDGKYKLKKEQNKYYLTRN